MSAPEGTFAEAIEVVMGAARELGRAEGLHAAADYIDATIREAQIVGDALAILLIIRGRLRLMATAKTSTDPTEEPDAERP